MTGPSSKDYHVVLRWATLCIARRVLLDRLESEVRRIIDIFDLCVITREQRFNIA